MRKECYDEKARKSFAERAHDAEEPSLRGRSQIVMIVAGKVRKRGLESEVEVRPFQEQERGLRFMLQESRAALPFLEQRAQGSLMKIQVDPRKQGFQ